MVGVEGATGFGAEGASAEADPTADPTVDATGAVAREANCFLISAGSSLPVAMMARTPPTFTLPPAGTAMRAMVPDSKASMGMVALSVSMSAISSPAFILSPSFLFHLMTVPSVIGSESWGMVISEGMGLQIQRFAQRTLRLYAGRWPARAERIA